MMIAKSVSKNTGPAFNAAAIMVAIPVRWTSIDLLDAFATAISRAVSTGRRGVLVYARHRKQFSCPPDSPNSESRLMLRSQHSGDREQPKFPWKTPG